ncbi:hypothetical protein BVRB_9g208340 isoform B [Beta vulgaris subsp. vulgaris]|nr:hypothetical protein BVRB_9g208340 isoform B [Beta vulgaris subsp. vulgaris]
MENEVKKKLDEEKYEEVVDYVNTINHDVVFSSEDLFDSKLKCLNLLNRKKAPVMPNWVITVKHDNITSKPSKPAKHKKKNLAIATCSN